jgi:opacity protein-like surface antigen
MRKAIWAVGLSLAAASACCAQESGAEISSEKGQVLAEPAALEHLRASVSGALFSGAIRTTSFPALPAAAAQPAPRPVPPREGESFDRWQVGLAYTYVRFSSTPLSANLNGINSSMAYMFDRRLGVEGSVTTAFSTLLPGFANEHAKFLSYLGGLRYTWPRRSYELWAHGLAGGVHMLPQLAGVGENGFAFAAGGGLDYPLTPGLAVRVQGNWLGARLFSQTQNNFQIAAGFFIHF